MTRATAFVVTGPGTNRDAAAVRALERCGAQAEIMSSARLVAAPELLDIAQLLVIAGGFSHGDALGAGRMMALELTRDGGGRLGDALRRFVERGRPVLGICNGFQVLTRAGLLPGALGHNDHGRFRCEWVRLEVSPSRSVWTAGIDTTIDCPIAHGEGRYVHADPAALAASGQVALRYCGANPNGSVDAIAGVCDQSGLVLGMMPHPEDHVVAEQHPHHRRGDTGRGGLGLQIFAAGLDAVGASR